jgi:hypothetical protein
MWILDLPDLQNLGTAELIKYDRSHGNLRGWVDLSAHASRRSKQARQASSASRGKRASPLVRVAPTGGTVVMQAVGLYTTPRASLNPNSNLPLLGLPGDRFMSVPAW